MSDILDKIASYKRDEVAAAKKKRSMRKLMEDAKDASPPRGFLNALKAATKAKRPAVIAEIKKASPSKGMIRENFDPEELARDYEKGGATCLSVLTDTPSFHGAPEDLGAARGAVSLPVLRKDFMLEPYQIVQSRALGADAILVILAMVDDTVAESLIAAADDFGMDALIEVHDEDELKRALELNAQLIGINNRDLKTFKVDIATAIRLKAHIPSDRHVVAESGLSTSADLKRLAAVGIHSYLIGESLMREPDVEAATHELIAGAMK